MAQSGAGNVLLSRFTQVRLTPEAEGRIRIDLSVKDGYKIAKRPAPKLQIAPNPLFEVTLTAGFSESAPGKDPDYFGRFSPLELKVVPGKTTRAGQYSLEGKLTYFYCSGREKYCSRSVESLELPVEVIEKK